MAHHNLQTWKICRYIVQMDRSAILQMPAISGNHPRMN